MKYVDIDISKYLKLEKAYKKAVSDNEEIFIFEKQEYVTGYAKYLIEYLKKQFLI